MRNSHSNLSQDWLNIVRDNSDDYNIATLLNQVFIKPETYLNSDTFNGDANYVLFRSNMPFQFHMGESTCNKAYGFAELAEDKYDLDLYPNKTSYGLYKRNTAKSDRVFVSYPTNSYNETTKYISTSTKVDNYTPFGSDSLSPGRGLSDNEDTSLNLYNEEIFKLSYYNNDNDNDKQIVFTNNPDTISMLEDVHPYSIEGGTSAYQSLTIDPAQLVNFRSRINDPNTGSTGVVSDKYNYSMILKKIRLYINSEDYNTNTNNYISASTNNKISWTLYECSNPSSSLTNLNTDNTDNESSNNSFIPYTTDNRFNTTELETEITARTYIHEVLSGYMKYEEYSGNHLLVTTKDAYPSTASANIYLNNNPIEYIGNIKFAASITDTTSYITAYQPTKYFILKITNNSANPLVINTQYPEKVSENNRVFSSIQNTHGQNDKESIPDYYYQFKIDMTIHVLENSVYNAEPKLYYDDHIMISPNVVSFLSSKYVKMRCLEIENMVDDTNLSTGFFSAGLAIIPTRSLSKVYNDISTNYHSIDYKNFHPIGKLTRLTFRFEDDEGNLIDFQGLDHYFTLLVTYRQATKHNKFTKSILNPNYDGNFINHLKYKEEREETIASLNHTNRKEFMNKEQELLQKFEREFTLFRKQQLDKNNIFNDHTINYKNEIINPNREVYESYINNKELQSDSESESE